MKIYEISFDEISTSLKSFYKTLSSNLQKQTKRGPTEDEKQMAEEDPEADSSEQKFIKKT